MLETFARHWREYLMEALGLAGFVLGAGSLAVFLEHPDFPAMRSSFGGAENAIWRRVPLGLIMGAYIAVVIYLFGEKSGAHINPATTWAFFRLKKINFADSVFYTLAQFAGAIAAALVLKFALGGWFAHPLIDFGITKPMPPHDSVSAFVAEFIISFVLMFVVLIFISSKRLEKYAAVVTGVLIALYLIFELPFSGMSLNPARSFAAAFAANEWEHLWIYFVAPPAAMLLAAEIFERVKTTALAGIVDKELPNYPKED
ncbi:MAG: aquaporin [Pyrinomonadaceae bacterium]|nr:aquaporin [Pyrinomonadaceae bacterium]